MTKPTRYALLIIACSLATATFALVDFPATDSIDPVGAGENRQF